MSLLKLLWNFILIHDAICFIWFDSRSSFGNFVENLPVPKYCSWSHSYVLLDFGRPFIPYPRAQPILCSCPVLISHHRDLRQHQIHCYIREKRNCFFAKCLIGWWVESVFLVDVFHWLSRTFWHNCLLFAHVLFWPNCFRWLNHTMDCFNVWLASKFWRERIKSSHTILFDYVFVRKRLCSCISL